MPIFIQSKQRRIELLGLLNENDYLSGEMLAEKLGVSRTMLWKDIDSLKKQGFKIKGVTASGYKITAMPKTLSADYIASKLASPEYVGTNIKIYDEIESTHTEAKRLPKTDVNTGLVILAKKQSAGRGRLGREWASPEGGIWMSVILSPGLPIIDIYRIGLGAALSGAKTLRSYGLGAAVKWPNDIMINNRKVGGILLEAQGEADNIASLILSIGLNANFSFADMDKPPPGAISAMEAYGSTININNACADLISNINDILAGIYSGKWAVIYQQLCEIDYLKGKRVKIELPEKKELVGTYNGISETGQLHVLTDRGVMQQVSMGEIVKVYYGF